MELKEYVRDILDFPQKGIIFKDITPILKDPEAFGYTIKILQELLKDWDFDFIVAPEARGFLFASPLAYTMKKGLIPVRKPGKLPYKTVNISYNLEYGSAELQMHVDALKKGDRVVIVDDVLATGGTLDAIRRMVNNVGADVEGVLCMAELGFLKGRERLKDLKVASILKY
ncbi:MAG TPA: adenine phosphoribosyltransferase [Petrotogaceae bacterium]|jgi:adenine phosphoribosyltransferase|nr:adenine phosphoribosyltransferase [Petrotogaceae bacterium]HNY36915.1 adenine phosphoribosyltransferase [Petrotogaceae bacterium]HOG35299.1 adenine phosphoribosyltransferase [Petrotogaceae bacterium]HOT32679.1 adenine phosphoribosyltransferase [Petrotogaceae bacterium]HPX15893.1 adenine phosphoribosyltransferase [Petrotogaceae bacterium]